MKHFLYVFVTLLMFGAAPAQAQQSWIQIEAQPTLSGAEERARAWAAAFPEVNGFRLPSGWYAIVLGPYGTDQAGQRLATLRGERLIPADSFLSDGLTFRDRFWPAGAAPLAPTDIPQVPVPTEPDVAALPDVPVAPEPDESLAEARASEALLSLEDRQDLQTALQWFGFYDAAIDGAFGRGTRSSMAAWQAANGLPDTGILTTRQRAALTGAWRGELEALGLGEVTEDRAGIALTMPVRFVRFEDYAPPFVRYVERDGSGVQVLLISQDGGQAALDGLYDVMQTLEIVPLTGFRERSGTSFTLTGQGPDLHSYTWARLEGGQIKGFTLVYPPDQADTMTRAAAIMKDSLRSTGPALDPTLGSAGATARRDLLAGLEVRQAERTRSGVWITPEGAVLTVADAVAGCARVTLEDTHEARVTATDGIFALLTPETRLAPPAVGRLAVGPPRIGAQAAVAGYSFGPALPAATVTFGAVEDLAGLAGEPDLMRLAAATEDGDIGGPVLDPAGQVAGLLLPDLGGTRQVPPGVQFAAKADAAAAFLAANGITASAPASDGALAVEDVTRAGMAMTVLVSCWN